MHRFVFLFLLFSLSLSLWISSANGARKGKIILTDLSSAEEIGFNNKKNKNSDDENLVEAPSSFFAPPSMFVSQGMPLVTEAIKAKANPSLFRKKIKLNEPKKVTMKVTWNTTRPPIVLLPGVGGSQLHTKLNKSSSGFLCRRTSDDFFLSWLDIFQVNSARAHCFVDNLSVYLTLKPGGLYEFDDAEGVQVRTLDVGETDGIDFLDPRLSVTSYFSVMTEFLEAQGYEAGRNLHGAPYDFRYTPFLPRSDDFFSALKSLIEKTFEANNKTKVVLMGHSYGGLWSLVFLNRMEQDWKDKYIGKWITLGTPFAGAHLPIASVLSGDAFGIPLLKPILVRPMERTLPSQYVLFPSANTFASTEPVVVTATRNYTVGEISDLFRDLNLTQEELTWKIALQSWKVQDMNPGVKDVFCLYGKSVQTGRTFIYKDNNFDNQPEMLFGDGDGTVPLESLQSCKRFPNTRQVEFEGVNHRGVINDEKVLEYILQLIQT